jgi:hypothetical protein
MSMNCIQKSAGRVYLSAAEAFTQARITTLRDEIASLRQAGHLYLLKKHPRPVDTIANESRRIRLVGIQEELLKMKLFSSGVQGPITTLTFKLSPQNT